MKTKFIKKFTSLPTSKQGLWASMVLTVLLCIAQLCTDKDITAVICASFTELSVYSGFYMWKSKVENRSKYALQWVDRLAKEYGIEAITPIIQSVIQD